MLARSDLDLGPSVEVPRRPPRRRPRLAAVAVQDDHPQRWLQAPLGALEQALLEPPRLRGSRARRSRPRRPALSAGRPGPPGPDRGRRPRRRPEAVARSDVSVASQTLFRLLARLVDVAERVAQGAGLDRGTTTRTSTSLPLARGGSPRSARRLSPSVTIASTRWDIAPPLSRRGGSPRRPRRARPARDPRRAGIAVREAVFVAVAGDVLQPARPTRSPPTRPGRPRPAAVERVVAVRRHFAADLGGFLGGRLGLLVDQLLVGSRPGCASSRSISTRRRRVEVRSGHPPRRRGPRAASWRGSVPLQLRNGSVRGVLRGRLTAAGNAFLIDGLASVPVWALPNRGQLAPGDGVLEFGLLIFERPSMPSFLASL